jgi:hypothetical protein
MKNRITKRKPTKMRSTKQSRVAKNLRWVAVDNPAYWKEMLRRSGLAMDAGRDSGHRKLKYVGSSSSLVKLYEHRVGEANGLVHPSGAGPDE